MCGSAAVRFTEGEGRATSNLDVVPSVVLIAQAVTTKNGEVDGSN